MNCSIAFQYLPMNAGSDDEVCRIVDEVIAVIDASGLDYYVGPFETAVEGDLDSCMALVKRCLEAGAQAGRMKQQGRMWVLLPSGAVMAMTLPSVS